MSAMSAIKSISVARTAVAAGALVLGLAMSTGQLTAASLIGDSSSGANVDLAMVRQPTTTETTLLEDSSPDVFTRAARTRDAIGFPAGSRRSGRHVHDGPQRSDYDEVAELDSAGQPLSMTQFDNDGLLVAAVRFDTPPVVVARVSSDAATKSAQRGLSASGVAVAGQAQSEANDIAGGWDVHWDRVQGGFAVRGDEARVHIWQDGRIGSVGRVEHKLAAAPARLLSEGDARVAVTRQMDRWFGGSASGYAVQEMKVQWVGPNAAFDPSKVDAAPEPYRLAWVVNVKPTGPASNYMQLITLYVDAGDGKVIGGDVVE